MSFEDDKKKAKAAVEQRILELHTAITEEVKNRGGVLHPRAKFDHQGYKPKAYWKRRSERRVSRFLLLSKFGSGTLGS